MLSQILDIIFYWSYDLRQVYIFVRIRELLGKQLLIGKILSGTFVPIT